MFVKTARHTLSTIVLTVASLSFFTNPGAAKVKYKDLLVPTGLAEFEKHTMDFGKVMRGEKLKARFEFTNRGNGPLTIQGIQAACGCTAVEFDKGRTYNPGEKGMIDLTFDTKDFRGRVVKTVTIMTNEKQIPDRTLTMTADIQTEFIATPPVVDFGEVNLGESSSRTVKVQEAAGFHLQVGEIKTRSPHIEARTEKGDKQTTLIHLTLKKTAPLGFLKEIVMVGTNSSTLPEMPLPVRANIKGSISLAPSYIEFGSVAPKQASERVIQFSGKQEFKISDAITAVVINGENTKVDPRTIMDISIDEKSSQQTAVKLNLSNPGDVSGSVHGKITFKTDKPEQENLSVDFYAFFR